MGAIKQSVGRSDLHFFRPEDLVLITDKSHPLYDERVEMPLNPAMVRNVCAHGIIEPVVIRRNGDAFEVVAGRQRVRWALAANEILAKDGQELVSVPCKVDRSSDKDQVAILIAENECRTDDNPVVKLEKLQRLMSLGRDEEQCAVTFAREVSYVKSLLKLSECSPKVISAVRAGKLSLSAAVKLAGLAREEQDSQLETLEDGATVAETVAAVKASKGEKPASKIPGKKAIKKFLAKYDASLTQDVKDFAIWILEGEKVGLVAELEEPTPSE
jgi:ParB family chromosome partitioning protein